MQCCFPKYGLWPIVVYNSNLVSQDVFKLKEQKKEKEKKTERESKKADTQ